MQVFKLLFSSMQIASSHVFGRLALGIFLSTTFAGFAEAREFLIEPGQSLDIGGGDKVTCEAASPTNPKLFISAGGCGGGEWSVQAGLAVADVSGRQIYSMFMTYRTMEHCSESIGTIPSTFYAPYRFGYCYDNTLYKAILHKDRLESGGGGNYEGYEGCMAALRKWQG